MGLYCLALVPANTLPKTPLGGIHISDTKQLFLEGALHPCNILMCPHTCVTNMPKPRQKQPGQSVCKLHERLHTSMFFFMCKRHECWVFVEAPSLCLVCTVGVGPASILVGNLVAGKRIAQAAGRDLGMIEDQDLVRKVWTEYTLYLCILVKMYSNVKDVCVWVWLEPTPCGEKPTQAESVRGLLFKLLLYHRIVCFITHHQGFTNSSLR